MCSKREFVGRIIVEQRSKPLWHSKWNPDWFIRILFWCLLSNWWFQPIWKTCFKLHHFPIFRHEHKNMFETTRWVSEGSPKTPPSPKVCQPSSCSRWTSEWQEKKTLRERTSSSEGSKVAKMNGDLLSHTWSHTVNVCLEPKWPPCHQFKPFARVILFQAPPKKGHELSWTLQSLVLGVPFSVDTYLVGPMHYQTQITLHEINIELDNGPGTKRKVVFQPWIWGGCERWPKRIGTPQFFVPGTPSVLFFKGNFTPKTSNCWLKNKAQTAFQVENS